MYVTQSSQNYSHLNQQKEYRIWKTNTVTRDAYWKEGSLFNKKKKLKQSAVNENFNVLFSNFSIIFPDFSLDITTL